MFTVDEYRHELWREVTERAQDHDIYDQEAFFETACEILRDSEAIAAYHPAYTRYRMGTPQALAIDGYDQDAFEMDESIVVIACDDKFTLAENDALPTIQSNECKRYFNAMRRFVVAALNSTYQAHAEESSETLNSPSSFTSIDPQSAASACISSRTASTRDVTIHPRSR